jgi:DNA-binding transcriptional ArsR family regulator
MDLSHPVSAIVVRIDARIYEIFTRSAAPVSGLKMTSLIGDASYAGVMAALNRLLEQGLLLMERDGVANMYRANREHILWPAISAAVAAANGALALLQKRISKLLREHVGAAIANEITLAVIGPVVRGQGAPDSDLDLLGIFPLHLDPEVIEAFAVILDQRVRRWSGNACNLRILSTKQLNDMLTASDPQIEAWRAEAVTFHGVDLEKRLRMMIPRAPRGPKVPRAPKMVAP